MQHSSEKTLPELTQLVRFSRHKLMRAWRKGAPGYHRRMSQRWKPSVTVAAIVERDGRYLFVEEQTSEGLRLNNPAGHLDPGESLLEAVVREVLEETARPFTPHALVGVYLMPSPREPDITFLRFAFTGTVADAVPGRVLDEGIVRTLWLSPDELRACAPRHRSPLVLRGIEDHLAGRRYPLEVLVADGYAALGRL
jgi:8-oxo-dGTP pyrophosphatase MutT (NUDIX family)